MFQSLTPPPGDPILKVMTLFREDPRSAKVDAIDWIERIPFEETRNYVAKVLSNIQIYRARLGQQPALRLTDDLGLGG